MGNAVAGARDFALIAVEELQWHVEEKGSGVDVRGVGVVECAGEVPFAIGLLQSQLAFRGGNGLLRGTQIGPVQSGQ